MARKGNRDIKREGYRAVAKFIIASPTKVRPVANLIKNEKYPNAMAILENMPQKGARLLYRVLKSAASNALNIDKKLDEDSLFVKTVLIDEGPRLKRIWFRGKGRADMLLKRMCHITVVVDEGLGE